MKAKCFSALTVLGQDESGIIAKVTKILFREGCNLEDVSMTVLEGELAMILMVGFSSEGQREGVARQMERFQKKTKLTFFWKHFNRKLRRGESHLEDSETYIITVMGRDHTGIVNYVSQLLAKENINIYDLHSRILGQGRRAVYAMMLEIDLRRNKNKLKSLKQKLARLAKKIRVEIQIRPVERLTF